MRWYEEQWADSVDFKDDLIELLDASKFGTKEYTPYEVYIKALYEYFKEELGADAPEFGRSAVDLAEFQEDAVKKARRILARYDGVLIADSVGLGKTWIGKKLLEDFAYHRRQKAVVVCSASLRAMWQRELGSATIAAQIVGMEELGPANFDPTPYGDCRRDPDRREPQLPQRQGEPLPGPRHDHPTERRPGPGRRTEEGHPAVGHADQQRPLRPGEPDPPVHAEPARLLPGGGHRRPQRLLSSRARKHGQPAGRGGGRRPVQPARRGHGPQHPALHQGGVPERHDQGQAGRLPRSEAAHRLLRPGGDLRRALRRDRRRHRRPLPGPVQAGGLQEEVGHQGRPGAQVGGRP